MKKVLVVSYFFPPLNNMGAKRFGTMCKYFGEYGYETTVLTSHPHANCFLNTKLDLNVPKEIHKIIRIGQTGVSYVPTTAFSQMIVQWLNENNLQTRTLECTSLGWYEKVKREVRLSELIDTDIIIGTFPSMENLLVSNYLSRRLKCPFVADIRDLITEYSETEGDKKRSFLLDEFVERLILRKASGIIPVTSGFGEVLRKKYPKSKIKVVFNGWEESCQAEATGGEAGYLYYAGALYTHRLESFELLMSCLKEVVAKKKVKMKVRSVGPRELNIKMKNMITANNMDEYIEILEAAEERIIKKEQANACINVVLSSIHEEDKALMATVPGKVYEAMQENAPILAIIPEKSDTAQIIAKTEKGIATTSKEKIVDFILDAYSCYAGNEHIEFFSRKNQAKRYCRFLDFILGERVD